MRKEKIKKCPKSIPRRIMRKMDTARGQIFTASDFETYGLRNAVDKALWELLKRGGIKRLTWGLYYIPEKSKLLGSIPPNAKNIANAIARKQKSALLVSGAQAANDLGLSTQVPAKYEFYTNGWPLQVRIKKMTITFKHKTLKKMAGAGKVSGHVFQALRYLGKERIMHSEINTICSRLSIENIETLKKDAPLAPIWMRPILKEIINKSEKLYHTA